MLPLYVNVPVKVAIHSTSPSLFLYVNFFVAVTLDLVVGFEEVIVISIYEPSSKYSTVVVEFAIEFDVAEELIPNENNKVIVKNKQNIFFTRIKNTSRN